MVHYLLKKRPEALWVLICAGEFRRLPILSLPPWGKVAGVAGRMEGHTFSDGVCLVRRAGHACGAPLWPVAAGGMTAPADGSSGAPMAGSLVACPRTPVYGGYPLGQAENFRRAKSGVLERGSVRPHWGPDLVKNFK